jgi:uncharacterized protein YbaA (DUF1428 family)
MAKKNTGKYVDGFVIVVPKAKTAAYKKMAQEGKAIWMKHGALDYKECIGDDLVIKASMGGEKARSFPQLAGAKKGQTVWFSFITFKSKAHRDQVNAKVMKAMEKAYPDEKQFDMPFKMSDMAYGGFRVEVG